MKWEKYIWRLGDTSWRVKNQIGLYDLTLEFLYQLSESGEAFDKIELYNYMYENGIKKNPEPSKISDINLLLKTLHWLGLITIETKELTKNGLEFYKTINQDINLLNPNSQKLLHLFGISDKQFAWICLLMDFELSENYHPFRKLFLHLLENDFADENWIKIWMQNKTADFNKTYETNENEMWKFEKPPSTINYWNNLIESQEIGDSELLSESILQCIAFDTQTVSRIISIIISESGIIKTSKGKRVIPFKKVEENIDKITKYFISMKPSDFKILTWKAKNKNTINSDYFSIMKYWFENLGCFKITEDKYKLKINMKICLSEMLKNGLLSSENDSKQFLNFYKKFNDVNENDTYLKLNYVKGENVKKIPFDFVQVCKFFEDFETMPAYDLLLKNNLAGTRMPVVVEYFVNLFIWYKIREINPEIEEFQNCCNTSLDSDLLPVFTASGGKPDGLIETFDSNIVIESTVLKTIPQLISNESESIKRHAWNQYKSNNKKTIIFFFSLTNGFKYLQIMDYYLTTVKEDDINNTKVVSADVVTIDFNIIGSNLIDKKFKSNFKYYEQNYVNKIKPIIEQDLSDQEVVDLIKNNNVSDMN